MPFADYLAGAGAEFFAASSRDRHLLAESTPSCIIEVKLTLYHLPLQQSLTLNEHPHIHYPPLAAYLQQHPTHRQDLVRLPCKIQGTCMCSRTKNHLLEGQVVMAKAGTMHKDLRPQTLAQRAANSPLWTHAYRD